MKGTFTVSLKRIIDSFNLEALYLPKDSSEIYISSSAVNRPGLELGGFFEHYNKNRIQILGRSETSYIAHFDSAERSDRICRLLQPGPPAVIISRGIEPESELSDAVRKYGVPLLRTNDETSAIMSDLISFLNVQLAPRVTRHGVFVEVYGEGILLLGESGVGKSETAIELIKRGHRLVADDAVEIRKVSSKTLVGSAPDKIRHFIELRGIGIINARRIFGMGSVKLTEKIDLIINLEQWDPNKIYDRMGIESETTEILGNHIPSITIPVKPGRNLAIIIEVAAMNNRQKKMGFNAAKELLKGLGMYSETDEENRPADEFSAYE